MQNLSLEEFAFWSENAQWMHSQMMMVQQTNALGAFAGGARK